VALIKTGNPKIDINRIAAYLNNGKHPADMPPFKDVARIESFLPGRTAYAVEHEMRKLKKIAQGGETSRVKRSRDSTSPDQTIVKAEPRPIRETRPSAKKRRYDEVVESGLLEDTEDEKTVTPAKRKRRKGKFEHDSDTGPSSAAAEIASPSPPS
jgi:hypothetical protein